MKKVISGKTILHNNATNATFIATDLDEQVQTGSRPSDTHITWEGELDIAVTEKEYKPIAEALFKLLASIEGSEGLLKDNECGKAVTAETLLSYVLGGAKKRHEYLIQEGEKLIIPHTYPGK